MFTEVTEVFILVPALLGLKGNLEMTLASRLSTAVSVCVCFMMWFTLLYFCARQLCCEKGLNSVGQHGVLDWPGAAGEESARLERGGGRGIQLCLRRLGNAPPKASQVCDNTLCGVGQDSVLQFLVLGYFGRIQFLFKFD